MWSRMVTTHVITHVYKYSLTSIYSPKVNIWPVLQVWNTWVGSLKPLLILIIEFKHSSIHYTNVGNNQVWNKQIQFLSATCRSFLYNVRWNPTQIHVSSWKLASCIKVMNVLVTYKSPKLTGSLLHNFEYPQAWLLPQSQFSLNLLGVGLLCTI